MTDDKIAEGVAGTRLDISGQSIRNLDIPTGIVGFVLVMLGVAGRMRIMYLISQLPRGIWLGSSVQLTGSGMDEQTVIGGISGILLLVGAVICGAAAVSPKDNIITGDNPVSGGLATLGSVIALIFIVIMFSGT